MRLIPTRVHGVIDYLWSVALIAAPWALGFGSMWADAMDPLIVGAAAIFYTLITENEMGLRGVLPMRWHLWLDLAGGLFLAASPWLFGFAQTVWIPHVAFGMFSVAASFLTSTVPENPAVRPERFGEAA